MVKPLASWADLDDLENWSTHIQQSLVLIAHLKMINSSLVDFNLETHLVGN